MDAVGLRLIGAGLAMLGMIGPGIGLGVMFGNYFGAAMRNPSAAAGERIFLYIGLALTEALGILAFVIAIMIITK
jgi:F-type H+-transporting ATPase subunit c